MKLVLGTVFFIVAWGAMAVIWIRATPPPVELLGGDRVTPASIRPGGVVTIARNMRIVRSHPLTVTRSMIHGDCKKRCEIIDLPTSLLTLDPGEYLNLERDHIIPALAGVGHWRLVFALRWQDRFGRETHQKMPELTIEIVK